MLRPIGCSPIKLTPPLKFSSEPPIRVKQPVKSSYPWTVAMVLNKWSSVVVTLAIGIGTVVIANSRKSQAAQFIPPLGQRLYSLGSQQSAAPVVIGPSKGASVVRFMRDPDQPGRLKVVAPHPLVVHILPPVREKAGKLRFRHLRVSGHRQQPRVAFHLDTLPLARADEAVSRDFYPKIFEPAKDDAF